MHGSSLDVDFGRLHGRFYMDLAISVGLRWTCPLLDSTPFAQTGTFQRFADSCRFDYVNGFVSGLARQGGMVTSITDHDLDVQVLLFQDCLGPSPHQFWLVPLLLLTVEVRVETWDVSPLAPQFYIHPFLSA